MFATLDALLAQPVLLILVLAVGAGIGIAVERLVDGQRRAEKRAALRARKTFQALVDKKPARAAAPIDHAADQLKTVMRAQFQQRALLNRPEARCFRALDEIVRQRHAGWRVLAQVSVGEFIGSDDAEAYRCVNSKRVDLLLMDEACRARHAIEYQGTGHHQGSAAARDAIKREALRKAGIGFHEIVAGQTTPSELKRRIERLVPAEGAQALARAEPGTH